MVKDFYILSVGLLDDLLTIRISANIPACRNKNPTSYA